MKFFHTLLSNWKISVQKWQATPPIQRFNYFYNVGKFCSDLIGVRFYGDCKIVWYSGITVLVLSIYYICAIYTLIHHTLQGKFSEGLPCLSISGLYVSSTFAFIDAIKKRHRMNECVLFGKKYLYNEEFDEICSKSINKTIRRWITTIGIIFASIILGLIYPLYIWYHEGILYTLAGVLIPFVERNSNLDITINLILQTLLGFCAFNGLVSIHTVNAIVMNSVQLSTEIIKSGIKHLSVHLESGNVTEALIQESLTKIFKQIQRMDEYILAIADRHYWYFFLTSPGITYSIGLSIYAQYILGFPPGYGVAIMSFVQMAAICDMGQVVVDRNDEISDALYSDLNWYLLPIQYQRDVSHMIHRMQNGPTLTIGPFQTLNYNTLKIITQQIHSFLMLLLNFGK